MIVVFANTIAFFLLIINGVLGYIPWYVSIACCTAIFWVSTTREECYLTKLENKIRMKLGLPPIKGFIKHYLLRRFY